MMSAVFTNNLNLHHIKFPPAMNHMQSESSYCNSIVHDGSCVGISFAFQLLDGIMQHEKHGICALCFCLLLPYAIPPNFFPKAVIHTCDTKGSFMIFLYLDIVSLVTGYFMGNA